MNCDHVFHFVPPPINGIAHPKPVDVGSVALGNIDVDMGASDCLAMRASQSRQPPTLNTINFDVQSHIISFLALSDLSSLMRTCHNLYDVGLLPLCAWSKVPLNMPVQIMSFAKFLRLDTPLHSRAPLIKNLNLSLEEYRAPLSKASYFDLGVKERDPKSWFALPALHPLEVERLLVASRNSALHAFLRALRACHNLRCLHVDRWYDDVPISILCSVIASLPAIEDLRVPVFPRNQWNAECCALVKLPLRKLVIRPGRWVEMPSILSIFHRLSMTLVELDIPVCQWIATGMVFPHVKRLAIEFPASESVVSDLVRTFPNITHLSLRGMRHYHLCHAPRSREQEDWLREHSQYQWHALVGLWPSFGTVAAESPCTLYTLALPCHVPRLSIAYSTGDAQDSMLPTILTDARPICLEMRITQVHYKYVPLPHRFRGLVPGDPTTSLQRFVLTLEGDGIPDYLKVSTLLINELQRSLSVLSITHLLLKHSIGHFRASCMYTRRVVRTLCADAPACSATMAQAIPSLRWIGIHVRVKDGPSWLYCWNVSRRSSRRVAVAAASMQNFADDALPPVQLVEMCEDAGWDVLRAQDMDEFARPS